MKLQESVCRIFSKVYLVRRVEFHTTNWCHNIEAKDLLRQELKRKFKSVQFYQYLHI